jgi:hypothetical protein
MYRRKYLCLYLHLIKRRGPYAQLYATIKPVTMKNKLPLVSSTYFVSLIKAYLQGLKTRQEVLADAEAKGVLEPALFRPDDAYTDVTQLLMEAAREMDEHYYFDIVHHINDASDTTPTRAGLAKQLQALCEGELAVQELLEWATWYQVEDDELSAGVFEDFAVEFFCLDFLPKYYKELTIEKYERIQELFRHEAKDPLKEKISLMLLIEKEQHHFLFYLRNYLTSGAVDALDSYLLKKFGMDHHSFPYMAELNVIMHNPGQLERVMNKATLI